MAQRPPSRRNESPAEILGAMNAGLDTYSDPTTTNYKKWISSNNVFTGAFSFVQRARFANVAPLTQLGPVTLASASSISTMFPMTTTVTTVSGHGFQVGQTVVISGASTGFTFVLNGTWVIIAVTPTTFTFYNPTVIFTGSGGGATGGSALAGYQVLNSNFTTFKYYALPALSSYLIADNGGKLFSFDSGLNYAETQRIQPYVDPFAQGSPLLNGPWSRETLQNILYEMNGQVKQSGRGPNASIIEGWGLDAPDATPQIVISSGSSQNITNIIRTNGVVVVTLAGALTVPGGNGIGMINVNITVGDTTFAGSFVVLNGSGTTSLSWTQLGQNTTLLTPTGTVDVNITKSIGRSYAYAWENANKPHVGAPSPSSQYVLYAGQNSVIQCIEQGTVTSVAGSTAVVGVGTAFTSAWIGRYLWIGPSSGTGPGSVGQIVAVSSATSLTLANGAAVSNATNSPFQVYDPQATHLRLYESADGGATYFRTQRNVWVPSAVNIPTSGLQFWDNANSEPPNFPFTTEVSQLNNVPPPIGSFVAEYQGVLVVFGVPGSPQSFFYSNQTLTTIGQLQESFAPLNQYTLPIQNAVLNGWIEMPGAAIIWSNRQDMYRLTGLLTDNTAATAPQLGAQISRLPYNLGCVNPYAVELTPLGAIWMTPQAEIWLFTNTYAPRNIGRPIQNILNTISQANLQNVRFKYYHNNTRNWLIVACDLDDNPFNNTLLILDLDLLASNGSPSFFVFDMATNQPTWYKYTTPSQAVEVLYEPSGLPRLLTAAVDSDPIVDADYTSGFGTETNVTFPFFITHPWGNDSAPVIKRPSFLRFNTNRDPSQMAADNWEFFVFGIDDDFYTFDDPLQLILAPGVNDTSTLSGSPQLSGGSPFRHSPELFKLGAVNFMMGRRIQFQVNFPTGPGTDYQFRQIQIGFGPSPPR